MEPPPAKQRIIEPLDEKDLEQAERLVLWFQRNWPWIIAMALFPILLIGLVLIGAG